MKLYTLFALATLLCFTGCNTGSMTVSRYDGTTNQTEVAHYCEVTIVLWNLRDESQEIFLKSLSSDRGSLTGDGNVSAVEPRSITEKKLGHIPIFDFGTNIDIRLNYEIDGIESGGTNAGASNI